MDRRPVYHKDNQPYRIVSRPNGQWVAQVRIAPKGTPTFDNWTDLHSPCGRMQAEQVMYQHSPAKV